MELECHAHKCSTANKLKGPNGLFCLSQFCVCKAFSKALKNQESAEKNGTKLMATACFRPLYMTYGGQVDTISPDPAPFLTCLIPQQEFSHMKIEGVWSG